MIHRCLVLALVLIACGTAACGRSATLTQPTTTTQGSSFSIAGTIREHLPDGTSGPSIPGALVEVVGKAGVVRSATADDNGQYSIRDVGGSFDVRASKDGYKAETFRVGPLQESVTVDALIVPIPRTLIGIVTETFPTETVPIAGAKVEVVSGYNKGASVSTDADGHFSLADVWGRFDVAISRAGYEAKTIPASMNETVTRLDAALGPEAGRVSSRFRGNLCITSDNARDFRYSIWPYSSFRYVCAPGHFTYPTLMRHEFPVHRPGRAVVSVTYRYAGDYYQNFLRMQILCDEQVVADTRIAEYGTSTSVFDVELPRACMYQIRLFEYFPDVKGGDWTTYEAVIDHAK